MLGAFCFQAVGSICTLFNNIHIHCVKFPSGDCFSFYQKLLSLHLCLSLSIPIFLNKWLCVKCDKFVTCFSSFYEKKWSDDFEIKKFTFYNKFYKIYGKILSEMFPLWRTWVTNYLAKIISRYVQKLRKPGFNDYITTKNHKSILTLNLPDGYNMPQVINWNMEKHHITKLWIETLEDFKYCWAYFPGESIWLYHWVGCFYRL